MDLARNTAYRIINDIESKGAFVNIAVNRGLRSGNLNELDKAFATELVYGVISRKLYLDWLIGEFSSIKLKKISPGILTILRLGIYQMLFLDRVPDSAACNEAVKLARKYNPKSAGFVNAILRSISRKREELQFPDRGKEPLRYLSVRYSYPEWMAEDFVLWLGMDGAEAFMESSNAHSELCIRINDYRIGRQDLINAFADRSIKIHNGKYLDYALYLENAGDITALDEYREGYFQVQDESSMLVSQILSPKPGEKVLDVCSAPGGKTTHLAQIMGNNGSIAARDIYGHKLKLVDEAAERLGFNIINTQIKDAIVMDDSDLKEFDKVLVDAPCSGTGIIRKKPDIKWTRSKEDMQELIKLQKEIMEISCKAVKPGGELVYSTCSINPQENGEVIEDFLSGHHEFEKVSIMEQIPHLLRPRVRENSMISLYPHLDGIDGFFICKLRRTKEVEHGNKK